MMSDERRSYKLVAMKQLLVQYATYNSWANKKICGAIALLSAEQQHQTIISSFDSIFKTLLHLTDAESMWWQRLKLVEQVERPSASFTGDTNELIHQFLSGSDQWGQWVKNANEVTLTHVFAYQNTKKELFKQPVNEVLIHLFNHQSYHRGQLVTMLRQVGVDKIPSTDFIAFSRAKR